MRVNVRSKINIITRGLLNVIHVYAEMTGACIYTSVYLSLLAIHIYACRIKNMPESRWKPFFPQAMDSLQFEIIPEETSFEILPEESSLEFAPEDEDDCFVLETLPEICIPAPLLTPLPLQCLAASALPDGVRREIESVTASVADLRSRSASSEYSEVSRRP